MIRQRKRLPLPNHFSGLHVAFAPLPNVRDTDQTLCGLLLADLGHGDVDYGYAIVCVRWEWLFWHFVFDSLGLCWTNKRILLAAVGREPI